MSLCLETRNSITVETERDPLLDNLPWYQTWLRDQFKSQPQRLWLCLPGLLSKEKPDWDRDLIPVWNKVRQLLLNTEYKSIESITGRLVDLDILSVNNNYDAYRSAQELTFAIIGWQTMLYKPDFLSDVCSEFRILGEMDSHRGEARTCLEQSLHCAKDDLPRFLLGFGMMLPPRHHSTIDDLADAEPTNDPKVIVSKDLHAHILTKVCGIRVQWVESLSCHLELDEQSGTLFLYRYPSFCIASLGTNSTGKQRKGTLHSCGCEAHGPMPWACGEEITDLLREIVLSYRLLFGQSGRSRRLFRRLRPFENMGSEALDSSLFSICSHKHFRCPVELVEREEYHLAGDFPHLGSRLARLNRYASRKRPRSMRQLWRDKRDSTAWLALWSVLIFGSVSILLALIQTIFQIMQYSLELRPGQ